MRWFFRTQADQERAKQEQARKALDKIMRYECDYYAGLIPDVLAGLGIDHWVPVSARPDFPINMMPGMSGRDKVEILRTEYREDSIFLWVDVRKLPYNSDITKLYKPEVLETLMGACGRRVLFHHRPGCGAWYQVLRDGARSGIPEHWPFRFALNLLPKSARPLEFIVGCAENMEVIQADLALMPHYLIGGSTGQGKSTHMNSVLCQLIHRNTPQELQLLLIDLKQGAELGPYEGIPHLWRDIVTTPEECVPALQAFEEEMIQRSKMIAKAGVKNIDGWNYKYPDQKLPYLVLIIDEMVQVLLNPDKEMSKLAALYLGRLLSISRSSGGHVVMATQRPSSDIITPFVKTNATVRICFRVGSNSDSMVVIDRGDAAGLDCVGRAMYLHGPFLTELQSPEISEHEIATIIKTARSGLGAEPSQAEQGVTLQDLLDESIDNYGGSLGWRPLYQTFKGKIGRDQIRKMIAGLNGHPVEVHGKSYRVVDTGKGFFKGRRLQEIPPIPTELPTQSPRIPHDFLRGGSDGRAW
jgi:hypothetical protein